MNFNQTEKTARSLAERTRKTEFKRQDEPDRAAVQDEETRRLVQKWEKLLSSGEAVDREEIQRGHGVPDAYWQAFTVKHFELNDKYKHGEHFFSWGDGRFACLRSVDDEIGQSNIAGVLGSQGEKYELSRSQKSYESALPAYAEDYDVFSVGEESGIIYFERDSNERA